MPTAATHEVPDLDDLDFSPPAPDDFYPADMELDEPPADYDHVDLDFFGEPIQPEPAAQEASEAAGATPSDAEEPPVVGQDLPPAPEPAAEQAAVQTCNVDIDGKQHGDRLAAIEARLDQLTGIVEGLAGAAAKMMAAMETLRVDIGAIADAVLDLDEHVGANGRANGRALDKAADRLGHELVRSADQVSRLTRDTTFIAQLLSKLNDGFGRYVEVAEQATAQHAAEQGRSKSTGGKQSGGGGSPLKGYFGG